MSDPEKAAAENTEEDVEEEEEGSDLKITGKNKSQLTSAVLRNPQVLAALQSRINSMVGQPSDYIEVHEHEDFLSVNWKNLCTCWVECLCNDNLKPSMENVPIVKNV